MYCNIDFGCQLAKQLVIRGRPLHVQEIKPWRRVLHLNETVLNVTFNGYTMYTGKWNPKKFNVRDFSSILTILPNGDNDSEAALKESQNNFDRPIENGSAKSLYF